MAAHKGHRQTEGRVQEVRWDWSGPVDYHGTCGACGQWLPPKPGDSDYERAKRFAVTHPTAVYWCNGRVIPTLHEVFS